MNPLRHQLPTYSPLPLRAILDAARAAFPIGTDARSRLAEVIRRVYRADDAILCDSGTHALQLAIRRAWQILGAQSIVALPAFSCFDVGSAAVGVDARVTLYDLDPHRLAPDLDSLRSAFEAGARVAIVAPLYGIPVDWDAIERLAEAYGAVTIEDAAQGFGASWRGCPLGALGQLSVLSFGRGKGWSGIRGGALVARSPGGAEPALASALGASQEARVVIAAAAQWALGRPSLYGLPASIPWLGLGETRYKEPTAPQRMSRAAARLAERTREAAEREVGIRRARATEWKQTIPFGPHVTSIEPPADGAAGFLRFPLRLSRGLEGLRHARSALRLGAAPSYPKTLAALSPVAVRMSDTGHRWPGAEELVRTLVTLPTHSGVTVRERARILQLLSDYPD